ncbi:unnamed protein product [Hyaloperonospora brassicae]|uniref:Apple domain-containing protein n=1 Tax=Hyaloperonospora brassicae TaxID=162125 RepID=A0AAV0UWM6_HYABA|nr:unnamed protein product [Hyaloperonospora brassicae]
MVKFAPVVALLSVALSVAAGDTCSNANGDSCGDAAAAFCCQDNLYCMPWSLKYYQCLPLPGQCTRQFTNYDFSGGDIKTLYGLQPGDCCAACVATAGCLAYTFENSHPGTTACYLKAGMGSPQVVPGLVSAVLNSYTSDQDKTPKTRRFLAEAKKTSNVPTI